MSKFKVNTLETAPADTRATLEQVQKGMGFIPNLFGVFSNNPEILKSYLNLSDSFSKSGFSPLEQQVVLLTVSRENGCQYCMAAHTAISLMSKLDESVIGQLRAGEKLNDSKLESLRNFTARVTSSRGWIDPSDLEKFLTTGYSESQAMAVVLGVTMKTLSNYINHLAKTPLDDAFKPQAWTR
ncbi:MAG: carboxymuconolactone decarboxylase family protein [Bacteriovoracaceae bacterium]|nr:carboxymuconolactone decarboxylase family protein [Bacteriovoracaceae bacterium]